MPLAHARYVSLPYGPGQEESWLPTLGQVDTSNKAMANIKVAGPSNWVVQNGSERGDLLGFKLDFTTQSHGPLHLYPTGARQPVSSKPGCDSEQLAVTPLANSLPKHAWSPQPHTKSMES